MKDELMKKCLLTDEERKPHWEWVDDGDGYNQGDDWNIKTLLDAQLTKAIPIIAEEIRNGLRQHWTEYNTTKAPGWVRVTLSGTQGDIERLLGEP